MMNSWKMSTLVSKGVSSIQSSMRNLQLVRCMASEAAATSNTAVDSVDSSSMVMCELNKKRTGLLGTKIGMINVWDQWGFRHGCTVVQIEECDVVQVKTVEKEGYTSIQLGAGIRKERNVSKQVKGHLMKAGVPMKRSLQEFRVSENATLPIGTRLSAQHFVPGQYVDVCATSKGKGFQGVMKRHNFAGQPASHGNSKAHRKPGSTGQCQDPGKVFKGKKMPGRMGGERVTRDNLWVVKIDALRNLLYLKGSVPGNKGGIVRITDARKKPFVFDAPFPTFLTASPSKEGKDGGEGGEGKEDGAFELMAPASAHDPFNLGV